MFLRTLLNKCEGLARTHFKGIRMTLGGAAEHEIITECFQCIVEPQQDFMGTADVSSQVKNVELDRKWIS